MKVILQLKTPMQEMETIGQLRPDYCCWKVPIKLDGFYLKEKISDRFQFRMQKDTRP